MLYEYNGQAYPSRSLMCAARREVRHNRFFSSIDKERQELEAWFTELAAPNEKLARLCTFQFKLEKTDHS